MAHTRYDLLLKNWPLALSADPESILIQFVWNEFDRPALDQNGVEPKATQQIGESTDNIASKQDLPTKPMKRFSVHILH